MLLAGADEATVKSAMREYEEAMKLLQNYVQNPDFDYENRRLKVAQYSLSKAKMRADLYIKKLEEKKLEEESQLEIQAEKEYQDCQQEGSGSTGIPREEQVVPERQQTQNKER